MLNSESTGALADAGVKINGVWQDPEKRANAKCSVIAVQFADIANVPDRRNDRRK
jgi:hypothetical protein